jgi:hypothetical protein
MTTKLRAGDILLDRQGAVTKILVVDEEVGALHVRLYEGEYPDADAVRAALRAKTLTWSIGHARMALDGLDEAAQTTVTNEPVTDDELEGYRYYLEAMGDVARTPKPKEEGLLARFWRTFGGST